jgi:hypothetical protein
MSSNLDEGTQRSRRRLPFITPSLLSLINAPPRPLLSPGDLFHRRSTCWPPTIRQHIKDDKASAERIRLVLVGRCIGRGCLPLIRVSRAALGFPGRWYYRRHGGILQEADAVNHTRSVSPPSLLCAFVFHCRARVLTRTCASIQITGMQAGHEELRVSLSGLRTRG